VLLHGRLFAVGRLLKTASHHRRVYVAGGDAVLYGKLLDVVRTGVKLVGRPAVGSTILIHDVCRPALAVIIAARTCVLETV
jgi:hypothetical protein